jgi:thioredoxin 1
MAGNNVVTLSDSNFDSEVLQSNVPVLVDFWAEWCGPCKMMGPTIDQLADEYVGKAKVAKLNVDDNMATGSRFQIRSIPALLIFQGGQVREQVVGRQDKGKLAQMLNKYTVATIPSPQPQPSGKVTTMPSPQVPAVKVI